MEQLPILKAHPDPRSTAPLEGNINDVDSYLDLYQEKNKKCIVNIKTCGTQ